MAERERSSAALRAGPATRVGAVTLLPIERVVLRCGCGAGAVWACAAIEPYALVVREAGVTRVVGVGGPAPPLEGLPGIAGLDA